MPSSEIEQVIADDLDSHISRIQGDTFLRMGEILDLIEKEIRFGVSGIVDIK
jgi:hypothetical protein